VLLLITSLESSLQYFMGGGVGFFTVLLLGYIFWPQRYASGIQKYALSSYVLRSRPYLSRKRHFQNPLSIILFHGQLPAYEGNLLWENLVFLYSSQGRVIWDILNISTLKDGKYNISSRFLCMLLIWAIMLVKGIEENKLRRQILT